MLAPRIHRRSTVAGLMGLVVIVALAIKAHQQVGRRRYCLDLARKHAAASALIRKSLGVRIGDDRLMVIGQKYRSRALRDAEDHDRLAREFEHAAWRPWEEIPPDRSDPPVLIDPE